MNLEKLFNENRLQWYLIDSKNETEVLNAFKKVVSSSPIVTTKKANLFKTQENTFYIESDDIQFLKELRKIIFFSSCEYPVEAHLISKK